MDQEERIIQGASVCGNDFDEVDEEGKEDTIEDKNIENNKELLSIDENKDNIENIDNTDNKEETSHQQSGGEDENVLSNMKFEYHISQPVTKITEDDLAVIYDEHIKWLEALLNPNKKVFKGRANLSGANLNGFNLDGYNFSGGSFVGTSFVGTSLVGTNFTGADLSEADFSNAVLSNTKFKRAILNRAIFTNENKEGIDITLASTVGTVWNGKEEDTINNQVENKDIDVIDSVDVDVDVGVNNNDTEIIDNSNNIE